MAIQWGVERGTDDPPIRPSLRVTVRVPSSPPAPPWLLILAIGARLRWEARGRLGRWMNRLRNPGDVPACAPQSSTNAHGEMPCGPLPEREKTLSASSLGGDQHGFAGGVGPPRPAGPDGAPTSCQCGVGAPAIMVIRRPASCPDSGRHRSPATHETWLAAQRQRQPRLVDREGVYGSLPTRSQAPPGTSAWAGARTTATRRPPHSSARPCGAPPCPAAGTSRGARRRALRASQSKRPYEGYPVAAVKVSEVCAHSSSRRSQVLVGRLDEATVSCQML